MYTPPGVTWKRKKTKSPDLDVLQATSRQRGTYPEGRQSFSRTLIGVLRHCSRDCSIWVICITHIPENKTNHTSYHRLVDEKSVPKMIIRS